MEAETVVSSDSIQNRRFTESGKRINTEKAFANYIYGLKHAPGDVKENVKQEVEKLDANIYITPERLESLGDIAFKDSKSYYTLTQRWRGMITHISDDGFFAQLEDLNIKGTLESAEFFDAEISKDDKNLVKLGGVFYWSLGYANDKGSVKKESIIRFQRLPDWTERDFDIAFDNSNRQIRNTKWV